MIPVGTSQKEVACPEANQLLVTGGYESPAFLNVLTDRALMLDNGTTIYRLRVDNSSMAVQTITISWVCLTVGP